MKHEMQAYQMQQQQQQHGLRVTFLSTASLIGQVSTTEKSSIREGTYPFEDASPDLLPLGQMESRQTDPNPRITSQFHMASHPYISPPEMSDNSGEGNPVERYSYTNMSDVAVQDTAVLKTILVSRY